MSHLKITTMFADATQDGAESPSNNHGPTYFGNDGGWNSIRHLQAAKIWQGRRNKNIRSVSKVEKGVRIEYNDSYLRLRTVQYLELVDSVASGKHVGTRITD